MEAPEERLEAEVDRRIEDLGYEVVDLRWAGSRRRPILRLRIDRADSRPGHGVTLDDCASVSRALERWLDEEEAVPERYVLEVSSPGVERPLVRPRHWRRFLGERVAVKGKDTLAGRSRRLEGELAGYEESPEGGARVRIRLPGGEEVSVPREEIEEAHLLADWR